MFKPGKLAWKHMNHVQNKTKHGVLGLAPRHVTAMQMGGAALPPTPPLFSAGQARVEAYESCPKQNKTWGSRLSPAPRHCYANGGSCAPPQPPRFFLPGKLAWKHMNHVQNKTKQNMGFSA